MTLYRTTKWAPTFLALLFLLIGETSLLAQDEPLNPLRSLRGFAQDAQSTTSGGGARKPNIIVIFTDDMGFADLRCQGQLTDLKTPHIDRLATEGIRFSHGYVTAPQCVPSRAGLVTGQYQQRFGLDENKSLPLPLGVTTIADRLKAAGYVTGMVGK